MASLDELKGAFEKLEPSLFADIWRTVREPDDVGPRWLELNGGSPADEIFVCVDFNFNVLRVERLGREQLTITFVPG